MQPNSENPLPDPQSFATKPSMPSPENYEFNEGLQVQENVDPAVSLALYYIQQTCFYLFVAAIIASILFFGWWGLKDYFVFGDEKFNQQVWLTAKPTVDKRCFRGDMAYELQQKLLLKGLPRENAIALLGAPTWSDDHSIEYDLGHCLWVEHGLRLAFDENGRLINSRIMQH